MMKKIKIRIMYNQKDIIWTYIYELPIPPNMGDDKNLDMNC
jgi:hypothetical protein